MLTSSKVVLLPGSPKDGFIFGVGVVGKLIYSVVKKRHTPLECVDQSLILVSLVTSVELFVVAGQSSCLWVKWWLIALWVILQQHPVQSLFC